MIKTVCSALLSIVLFILTVNPSKAQAQPSTQRPLVSGDDYVLSDDGLTLTRWFADDLTHLNMNLDPTLSKVKKIGEFCFYMNTSLSEVILSDQVVEIERGAFNATGLKKIFIPKSTKKIGVVNKKEFFNPFGECLSLTDIEVAPENRYFKVTDGYLTNKAGTTLLAYAMGRKDATLSLPEGVETIGGHAFAGSLFIKKITLPKSMKVIGRNAFLDVALLKEITLNEGLERIGFGAFVRTAIEEIDLPASFSFRRDDLAYESPFLQCKSLKKITLSPNHKSLTVGKEGAVYSSDYTVLYALPAANGLTEYTAPSTLRDIAQAAFSTHQTLTKVYIAQAIDYIPLRCFEGSSKLHTVTFATSCPMMGFQSFQDCKELQALHCLGRGIVKFQDKDALDGVDLSKLTLYVAPEEETSYNDHPVLKEVKIEAETPKYQYLSLDRDEQKALDGINSTDVIYNHFPEIASWSSKEKKIKGVTAGQTSILSSTGDPLYLIEVAPKVNTIIEPLLTLEAADEEAVKSYEQDVANRVEVKREPQFGGELVTYANPSVPGVEAKYLLFDGQVAPYISLVFETEAKYKELKGEEFFQERYLPAKGTDTEGEEFDGYTRLGRFGYELKKLSIGEDTNESVLNIGYFKVSSFEYKQPTAIQELHQLNQKLSAKQVGDRIEFAQADSYQLSLYTLNGTLLSKTVVSGAYYMLPKMNLTGLLVVRRASTSEILAMPVRL
ncbi:hypothetical protein HMPREF1869_01412 [Bacteroidales bacterium KA00251]|nr:hypothetical protein HMPREF1869_01412 [Bacteroidales bacterium KA00251]